MAPVLPHAGVRTAAEILAPSPGALLRRRIFRHWGLLMGGLITIPGAALFLLVLAINMLGDDLRDVTAPEHRA